MIDTVTNINGATVEFNFIDRAHPAQSSNVAEKVNLTPNSALMFRITFSSARRDGAIASKATIKLPIYSMRSDGNEASGKLEVVSLFPDSIIDYPDQSNIIDPSLTQKITALASSGQDYLTIDLKNIVHSCLIGGHRSFAIAIFTEEATNGFYVGTTPFFRVDFSTQVGREKYYDYTQRSVGFAGTSFVNNQTGELSIQGASFSTASSKMPINFSFYYCKLSTTDKNTMFGSFRSCFDYDCIISDDVINLSLPDGSKSIYRRIPNALFKIYGIKENDDVPYVFLNFSDFSYLKTIAFQGGTQIDIFDTQKNLLRLVVGRWGTLPVSYTKQDGYSINYAYSTSDARIYGATSNDGESIAITYDSSGRVSTVTFVEQDKRLSFAYAPNQLTVTLLKMVYNVSSTGTVITYVTLGTAYYVISSNSVVKIGDANSNIGLKFDYDVGKVTKITEINWSTQEEGQSVSLSFGDGEYTLIASFDGSYSRHYFDQFGMLTQTIDSQNLASTVNYVSAGLNGAARKPSAISASVSCERNILHDGGFEAVEGSISESSNGWKTHRNADVKISDNGFFGEKALELSKTSSTDAEVYQEIVGDESVTSYDLSFFAKGTALVGSGYAVVETYNDSGVLRSYRSQSIDNTVSDWTEFTIRGILTDSSVQMRVRLIGQQSSGVLCVDEIQMRPSSSCRQSTRNVLANGFFYDVTFNQPVGFDLSGIDTNEDMLAVFPDTDGYFKKFVGETSYKIQGVTDRKKYIAKHINLSGNPGDKFTLNLWAKAALSESDCLTAEITFVSTDFGDEPTTLTFKSGIAYWQFGSLGVVARKPYTRIDVVIKYQGPKVCYLGGLSLTKDGSSERIDYDKKGNIADISSAGGTNIVYQDGKPISSSTGDGSTLFYDYDSRGNITKITDSSGNVESFTFDAKGNKTQSKIISTNNTASSINGYLQTDNSYDSKNRVVGKTDDSGNTTSYEYGLDGNIKKITLPSGLVITQLYDNLNNLTQRIDSKGTESSLNQFAYNNDSTLRRVICGNGTAFSLEYDSFKKLTGVKVGMNYLAKYEYNDRVGTVAKDNITKAIFGDGGDYYEYAYDSTSKLKTVKFNGADLYHYDYDEFGNLVKITGNGVLDYLSYTSSGNLLKETRSNGDFAVYEHDNLSNVQKSITKIDGTFVSEDYDYAYETSEYNGDAYKNRLDAAFDDDVVDYRSSNDGIHGLVSSCSGVVKRRDSSIDRDVVVLDKLKSFISYDLYTTNQSRYQKEKWNNKFHDSKAFFGWVGFGGTISQGHKVLSFSDDGEEKVFVTASNSQGTISFSLYRKSNGVSTIIGTSSKTVVANSSGNSRYVLLALKISTAYDDSHTPYTSIDLFVNGGGRVNGTTGSFLPSSVTQLFIGDKNVVGSSGDGNPFKESLIMVSIGTGSNFSQETLSAIHEVGTKLLLNGCACCPTTGVTYSDSTAYRGMDVVTLNGTFTSNQNLKPVFFAYADRYFKREKANLFEYDRALKKHVYGSYSELRGLSDSIGKLIYRLPLTTSGTVSIRFKINNSSDGTRTIFAFQNASGDALIYKVDSGNRLILGVAGVSASIDLHVSVLSNQWHALTARLSSSGLETFYDANPIISFPIAVDLTNAYFSVGCKTWRADGLVPQDHLEGNLEMLAFSTEPISDAQIARIQNGKTINRVYTQSDAFGRPEKDVIQTSADASNNIEQVYSYFSPSTGRTSTRVESVAKTISGITRSTDRYTYDAMGNVISMIKDEGTYQYQYDYLGRLVQEINPVLGKRMTYSYGGNDNICCVKQYCASTDALEKTWTYNYDSAWKDRLVSVVRTDADGTVTTEHSLAYSSTFVGNPAAIDGSALSFQGRRLTAFGGTRYAYDESGYLSSVVAGASRTDYRYFQGKLRSLTRGEDTVFFHYDERGAVVGIECAGTDYFYQRDLTGAIIAILRADGTPAVSYRYDAWGRWVNEASASDGTAEGDLLKELNPFLYKGYVYDSGTGLYFLVSRFYSPVLRRFLNADDCLTIPDSSSQNGGTNLFAYCRDNPVTYVDEFGTRPFRSLFGVSLLDVSPNIKSNFIWFGTEHRTSDGWEISENLYSSWIGRIGFSSYITHTEGRSGVFYAFAGSKTDIYHLLGTNYYVGVGFNFGNVLSAEIQLESLGIGAQVSVFGFSIDLNINLLGMTSLTFGHTGDLGNGNSLTNGFTIGVNTGGLIAALAWIYQLITTGNASSAFIPQGA